jgi:hypothetical protein
MDMQTYFSCLQKLNCHVNWLPGNDLPLTVDQLHQAFFDGMPTIWRERFENAGRSVHNTACAELLRFFQMPQKAADCSQKANKMKHHSENRTHGPCNSNRNSLRFSKKSRTSNGTVKADAKHQSFKSKEEKKKSGRISNHTKCPIHPSMNHTWGKCYANANNKLKQQPKSEYGKKWQGKAKNQKVNRHATQIEGEDMSITLMVTSPGGSDSTSNESAPCRQTAVNDNRTVSTETDGLFAQLCLDLNKHPKDPNALVAKFKAARAVAAIADTNNGTSTYDAFTSIATHHLHDLSFHAMQESNTNVYDKIVGLYIQYSDEVYSNRIQTVSDDLSFDKVLRLCATSGDILK